MAVTYFPLSLFEVWGVRLLLVAKSILKYSIILSIIHSSFFFI